MIAKCNKISEEQAFKKEVTSSLLHSQCEDEMLMSIKKEFVTFGFCDVLTKNKSH